MCLLIWQVQCKCHLEDKQQLQNLLSETQKHLGDVETKLNATEKQLEEEVKLRKQEVTTLPTKCNAFPLSSNFFLGRGMATVPVGLVNDCAGGQWF